MIISRGICCLKLLKGSTKIITYKGNNSSVGTQIRQSHEQWAYRDYIPASDKEKKYNTILCSLIWGWIIYHFINTPDLLYGEFRVPLPSVWTDEELGIPPDDAE